MTLICGVNPVLEALAAGTRHFDRMLVVKGLRGKRLADAIRRATRMGIPIRFEMRETLDRLAGGVPHQGIIAIVSEKPVLTLESLLETARQPALLVVLDGVEDPRNLGAILRTAEAAGADGVLLPERHSAGLSETVARASAGAIEHVHVARVGNLVQALEELKSRGIWIVGYDASGTERWDAVDLEKPVALVLGGEGRGIRRLVREHCDHVVSIPHFGHVSSLNVSVAAGVALYEAVRQRKSVPSHVRPIPRNHAAPQVIGPGPDDDGDEDAVPGPHLARGDAPEDELDSEARPASLTHIDFHEDVAWGRGPLVLEPVESRHLRRDGRRGKPGRRGMPRPGRRGEGRDRRGEAREGRGEAREGRGDGREARGNGRAEGPDDATPRPTGEPPSGGPTADAPAEGGAPRRGRGRRRRRRDGRDRDRPREDGASERGPAEGGGEGAPAGEGAPHGEGGSSNESGAPGAPGQGGDRPTGSGRRRRRHRHRRR